MKEVEESERQASIKTFFRGVIRCHGDDACHWKTGVVT